MTSVFALAPDLQVTHLLNSFKDSHIPPLTCQLLVSRQPGAASVLVNCHDTQLSSAIARLNLPQPTLTLATHIDSPLSLQGQAFPAVPCRVPLGHLLMAQNPAAMLAQAATTWAHPESWDTDLGKERWGIAGSRKYDPPSHPIPTATPITPADSIYIDSQTQLQPFSLPFCDQDSLGYRLVHQNKTLALFTGDAIQSPGKLVQVYSLETKYGFINFKQAIQTLDILAAENCDLLFPSRGPAITNGRQAIADLKRAIQDFITASTWRSAWFKSEPRPETPIVDGFQQRAPGVYQMKQYGNGIVLIDPAGHGLIVDPGPCDFTDPNRIKDFHRHLDLLHAHAGLRHIDTILITHFHGDHVDLVHEVKARYPGAKTCAWAPVARVIENPNHYPYACLLPWYNLPQKSTPCDHAITRDHPLIWHGRPITPVYTPGHARAHAAYLIDFADHRIAITGDSIQTNGELAGLQCAPCNDSVLAGDSSIDISYRNLINQGITLNLGGHGSWFTNCDYHYKAALERFDRALPRLRPLFPENALNQAFKPRWFPDLDTNV
jgi:glyoxylase-like metal-dependent hydrolase (beta-lactamase superfamily II)